QTESLVFRKEANVVYQLDAGVECDFVDTRLSEIIAEVEERVQAYKLNDRISQEAHVHIIETDDFLNETCQGLFACSVDIIDTNCSSSLDHRRNTTATFLKFTVGFSVAIEYDLIPTTTAKRRTRQYRNNNNKNNPEESKLTMLNLVEESNHRGMSTECGLTMSTSNWKDVDCRVVRKRVARNVQRLSKKLRIAAKEFWGRPDEDPFELSSLSGLSAKTKFKKWTVSLEPECPKGYESNGLVCVGCGPGAFLDPSTKMCQTCSSGTYQDKEAADFCKPCPGSDTNHTLESSSSEAPWLFKGLAGATSITECAGACPPGTFSRNGRQPCKPCPKSTFQTGYGRTECEACGANATTMRQGATSFQVCLTKEICAAGSFWNRTTGLCELCPRGFYQTLDQRDFCFACPGNSMTELPGAQSLKLCRETSCEMHFDGSMGYIETPNYPGNYPVSTNCSWTIKPPHGKRVLFFLPKLDISADDSCEDVLVLRKSTEYQPLIEEIIRDPALLSTQNHVQVFQDPELLKALMEVIAQPVNYYKYINIQTQLFPSSFIDLLTPKATPFSTIEGKCLNEDQVCDGEPHCDDMSDEKDCAQKCRVGDQQEVGTVCYRCIASSSGGFSRCHYFLGRINACPTEWCVVRFGAEGKIIARDCAMGMTESMIEVISWNGRTQEVVPCEFTSTSRAAEDEEYLCYCKGRLCNFFRSEIPLSRLRGKRKIDYLPGKELVDCQSCHGKKTTYASSTEC
ncbi:unnamed protein product, partial [Notodromas monacha]